MVCCKFDCVYGLIACGQCERLDHQSWPDFGLIKGFRGWEVCSLPNRVIRYSGGNYRHSLITRALRSSVIDASTHVGIRVGIGFFREMTHKIKARTL